MKFIRFAILALMTVLAWSCSDKNEPFMAAPEQSAASYLRLTLSVANPTKSRVSPAAGEDGDGREDGVNKENNISNIAIFIYDDHGDGLDSDPTTPLIATGFATRNAMTEENGSLVCTVPMGSYKPSNSHRAIVVANAGNITDKVSTLGELRTYPVTNAWTPAQTIAGCSDFVMSSAYNGAKRPDDDGHVRVLHSGTPTATNPNFAVSVSIERVAARIDIMYGPGVNPGTSGLFYNVKSALNSTLILTHVLPVNLMQQPTYMLKHVTDGTDTSLLLICGDETASPDGVATNYVITPHTLMKQAEIPASTLTDWYGHTRAGWIRNNPDEIADGIAIARLTDMNVPQPVEGNNKYRIICYANENTQLPDAQTSQFISGLVFRSIYRPKKIFTDADLTHSIAGALEGTTFWLLRPSNQLMGEDNCLYFASQEAASEYQSRHPELISTIDHYPGGICYYNLWIRHAGDFCAIVRNNIYRIALSFTGPGQPTPELTEPNNIESRIFVRRWNFRPQSEILM